MYNEGEGDGVRLLLLCRVGDADSFQTLRKDDDKKTLRKDDEKRGSYEQRNLLRHSDVRRRRRGRR